MKFKISTLIAILLVSFAGISQPTKGKGHGNGKDTHQKSEKIKAMKVEYITTKLELTSAEAEKFWPVYNEFSTQIHEFEMSRRTKMKESKDKELSDNEVNAIIKFNFDTEQDILDHRKAYDKKFKEVLSVQKVGELYKAEHEFKREILRKMKKQGEHKGQKK